MTNSVVSERDVEVKIITPLFRDILGYQNSEMHWAVPVDMNLGREVRKKKLIFSSNGNPKR